MTKKLYATFQDIHLINYISISAGEHVSATTAKVRKGKAKSGDGHVKTMLYNKLTQDNENIVNCLKCSYHLAKTEQPKSKFTDVIELVECLGINIQWNLSNLTHQATREMCWIVQDLGIFRFNFC